MLGHVLQGTFAVTSVNSLPTNIPARSNFMLIPASALSLSALGSMISTCPAAGIARKSSIASRSFFARTAILEPFSSPNELINVTLLATLETSSSYVYVVTLSLMAG